jgi:hypothetical protein
MFITNEFCYWYNGYWCPIKPPLKILRSRLWRKFLQKGIIKSKFKWYRYQTMKTFSRYSAYCIQNKTNLPNLTTTYSVIYSISLCSVNPYTMLLVLGDWMMSIWCGRAMMSSGPEPSVNQLNVMVAWSPDELADTWTRMRRLIPRVYHMFDTAWRAGWYLGHACTY